MKHGVLLMTYGSATTAADVPQYLASVYRGRTPSPEVVAEFERRYNLIGRSPLVEITLRQAELLQARLNQTQGEEWVVRAGMQHLLPSIDSAAAELADARCDDVLGLVLAPQFSAEIMGGYVHAFDAAMAAHLPSARATLVRSWSRSEPFLGLLARLVQEALARIPELAETVPILFTAHSLPRSVVERDPAYVEELKWTASELARRLLLPSARWQFAYQSAGHTPEEWLTPDFKDLMPEMARRGLRDVLVVPLQFLSDHLEILYDIDIAAGEEASAAGMRMHRIELPNVRADFITCLARVVSDSVATPAHLSART